MKVKQILELQEFSLEFQCISNTTGERVFGSQHLKSQETETYT